MPVLNNGTWLLFSVDNVELLKPNILTIVLFPRINNKIEVLPLVLVYYYTDGKWEHRVFKTKYGYFMNFWIYFNILEDEDKRKKMREVVFRERSKSWRAGSGWTESEGRGFAGQITTVCVRCDYTSSLLEQHPLSIEYFRLSWNPHKMRRMKEIS